MSEQNGAPEEVTEERSPLHESFLENLPEGVDREVAEQLVPHWDKYVQEQFTQRAEDAKAWEPYSQIQIDEDTVVNIRDIPPEDLAEILAYVNQPEEEAERYTGYEEEELSPLEQEVAELRATVQGMQEEREATTRKQQADASVAWVNDELQKIKKDYPTLTDQDMDDICALASRYEPSEDIVQKGFKDFQNLVGRTERDFFNKKADQPKPAERGGTSNTQVGPVTSYDEAGEAAKARVRQMLQGR